MKLIIDANIVVSCVLRTDSRLSQLYFDAQRVLKFIAPKFLRDELIAKREKLVKVAKQPARTVLLREALVLQGIEFIDPGLISQKHWLQAERLVSGIDMKDIAYVALSLHTGSPIWSGDKKLRQGLAKKNWNHVLDMDEVQALVRSL